MFLRILFVFVVFFNAAYADAVFQAAKSVKEELGKKNFTREYQLFAPYEKKIKKLQELEKQAYSKSDSSRFKILDELLKYQKQSGSLIIAQYMVDESLKYISTRDVKNFKKYIKPNADALYKRGMCDGYLFEGVYLQDIQGDRMKALDVYRNGVKNCSVKWKKMNILSRMNKLKYQLGMFGKK